MGENGPETERGRLEEALRERLWQELVEQRSIRPDLVEDFRRTSADRPWIPLGRILVDEGHLTEQQHDGIVRIKLAEPAARFGDLAIREGFCTVEQVESALAVQSRMSPGPIELILRDERTDRDAVFTALLRYVHHLEGRVIAAQAMEQLDAARDEDLL